MVHRSARSGGGSGGGSLPSLDSSSRQSASLRGSHHKKVPEISDRPLNTLLPVMKDGRTHPEPFYATKTKVFEVPSQPPPWLTAQKQAEIALLEFWRNNGSFQEKYLKEFIKDALFLEVSGICSSQLTEMTARNKQEAQCLSYLEDHVITDEVYRSTEEVIWECLWDDARKVGKTKMEDLEDVYGDKEEVDHQMLKVLKDNYTRPIRPKDGQPLLYHQWGELLYHLNRLMQRGSLMENYAIKKLQEQIITQVAAKVVLDEALKFMEDEMATMDEEERVDNPPRKG